MGRVGLKCSLEQSAEDSNPYIRSQRPSASCSTPQSSTVAAATGDTSAVHQYPQSRAYIADFRDVRKICLDILMSAGSDSARNMDPYFQSFNKWLPIVDTTSFYQRRGEPPESWDVAFTTLQLSCMLLSRICPPFTPDDQLNGEDLYLSINLSLTSLTSNGDRSLEVLQAKILLALYEHLKTNHAAAVGTIASAAVIAGNLGLLQWQCRPNPKERDLADKGMHKIAWCLYILER